VFADNLARRAGFAVLYGFGAAALAACNTAEPQSAEPRPGAPAVKIATITVDTSDLSAMSIDPTAWWVQSTLPGRLAKSFAPYMATGDPNAAKLSVRISSVALGAVGPAGAVDSISGEATLSGGTATPVALSAALPYKPFPGEQPSSQPALERRVEALTQTFADWLPRKFNL
jgi:hypothetical protein